MNQQQSNFQYRQMQNKDRLKERNQMNEEKCDHIKFGQSAQDKGPSVESKEEYAEHVYKFLVSWQNYENCWASNGL